MIADIYLLVNAAVFIPTDKRDNFNRTVHTKSVVTHPQTCNCVLFGALMNSHCIAHRFGDIMI